MSEKYNSNLKWSKGWDKNDIKESWIEIIDLTLKKVEELIDEFNLEEHKKPLRYCSICLNRLKQKLWRCNKN